MCAGAICDVSPLAILEALASGRRSCCSFLSQRRTISAHNAFFDDHRAVYNLHPEFALDQAWASLGSACCTLLCTQPDASVDAHSVAERFVHLCDRRSYLR